MALQGKGWFIWQVQRCGNGDPAVIAARAADAGCTHVLLKIAERTHAFGFDRLGRDLVAPVVEALHARQITAWGWHYVYGDDPAAEAKAALQRVPQLKLDGYVIDAEAEYKHPGKAVSARVFMTHLRQGLPSLPIALSSYRFPSFHQQLPWGVFLERCDYVMPQVYWEGAHNPAQQLERCVTEFGNVKLVGAVRPVIPTGSAYGTGPWQATPADIRQFLQRARTLQLPAANLYSWDFVEQPGQRELWEAAAAVDWPPPQPPLDIVEEWAAALRAGDVERVLSLYAPDAVLVTPERTRVGQAALHAWYTDLLHGRLTPASLTVQPGAAPAGNTRRFTWQTAPSLRAEDLLGLRAGRIAYHTTSLVSGA